MRKYEVSYRDWCSLEEDFNNHNDPVDYADCREGSLLDNFICTTNRYVIVAFERYATAWSSYLEVYVAQTARDMEIVWDKWYAFCEDYDAEFGEEE